LLMSKGQFQRFEDVFSLDGLSTRCWPAPVSMPPKWTR